MLFKFLLLVMLPLTTADLLAQSSEKNLDLTLKQYQGQFIYLDFWASWCEPCKESFPWLNSIHKKYPKLKIIGVNLDDDAALAKSFLKNHPIQFENIFDIKKNLLKKYKLVALPSSLIINKKGRVIHQFTGFTQEKAQKISTVLDSLLKENIKD